MMDAQAIIESGGFDAARKVIQAVISSPLSRVESKVFALIIEEKNERLSISREERHGSGHLDVVQSTARKLHELTSEGPGALKYYALVDAGGRGWLGQIRLISPAPCSHISPCDRLGFYGDGFHKALLGRRS